MTTRLDLYFEFVPGAFDSARVLCALVDLIAAMPEGFVLLWDGAPIHRSKEVNDFLNRPDVKSRVSTHRLPAYAPELNPVELVFSHAKCGEELANYCPSSIGELIETADGVLSNTAGDQELIRSFLLGSDLPMKLRDVVN